MKQPIAILLLIMTITSNSFAQAQKRDLQKSAEFFATAYLNKDYEACVKMMDPFLVEDLGGEGVAQDQLEKNRNVWEDLELRDIRIGESLNPVARVKDEEYAIVPYVMVLSDANGDKSYLEGYFLATSRINFDFWFFQNGNAGVAESLQKYSKDLYKKLNPPQRKLYNEDKSFLMIEQGDEWVPSEQTLEMMRSLAEDTEVE